jgi:hypothetical protein
VAVDDAAKVLWLTVRVRPLKVLTDFGAKVTTKSQNEPALTVAHAPAGTL